MAAQMLKLDAGTPSYIKTLKGAPPLLKSAKSEGAEHE